jgi:hypothetical protein
MDNNVVSISQNEDCDWGVSQLKLDRWADDGGPPARDKE